MARHVAVLTDHPLLRDRPFSRFFNRGPHRGYTVAFVREKKKHGKNTVLLEVFKNFPGYRYENNCAI